MQYAIKFPDMFPNPTSDIGWWSVKDGTWLSKDEIMIGRSGVADMYLNYNPNPPSFSDVNDGIAHADDIVWLFGAGISKG